MIYTAKRESVHPLRMHSPVGRRLPAYSTALGRAVLAEQPADVRAELVPRRDRADHREHHHRPRRGAGGHRRRGPLGYAVESDESCIGVRCFGVALPFARPAIDGLSVAVPMSRLDQRREDLIIETLLSVKARLAMEQGHSIVR